jgi:hypothetical protein
MTDQIQLYQVTFLVMAALSLYVGVRGMQSERPVIWRSSWCFAVPLLAAALELTAILAGWSSRTDMANHTVSLFHATLMASVYSVLSWSPRGYVLLGVTPASFTWALQHALGRLGLSYEARGSMILVASEGLALETTVRSLIGTAKIHAEGPHGRRRLADIAAQMAEYFASTKVETNRTMFGYCIAAGVSLLAVVLALGV